jgi:predicted transcriptional regulator
MCYIELKMVIFAFIEKYGKMDHFYRTIAQLLVHNEKITFNEILEKVDFTHNTLQQHLEELLARGIIERMKKPQNKPGRPTFVCKIPENIKGRPLTALMAQTTNWIVLSFDVLIHLCRHEKGGYCKEIRGSCEARNCPKILK